jgi:hypothetical protein
MNIAGMARRLLALLMMIFWLLAGFDVLENPNQLELYSFRAARLPVHGQAEKPSGDSVHADHSKIHYHFTEQRPAMLLIGAMAPWLKLDRVRNSALPSSNVGIAQTEFLNHSPRSWLNRMIGDFLAFQIVRERLSIERGVSIRATPHSLPLQTPMRSRSFS